VITYLVDVDQADDPESGEYYAWSAAEIRANLPQFAALFPDDYTDEYTAPTLTFICDVTRFCIRPAIYGDEP
jgi:hypothetical protein